VFSIAVVLWSRTEPVASESQLTGARSVASYLSTLEPHTTAVIIARRPPGLDVSWTIGMANLVRSATRVDQIPDVRFFDGGLADYLRDRSQTPFGDAEAVTGGGVGIVGTRRTVALAAPWLDSRAYADVARRGTVAARGVAALGPARQGPDPRTLPADPIASFAPILPVVLGQLLLAVLTLLGWPLSRAFCRTDDLVVRTAVAPALGFVAVSAWAMAAGAIGLHLNGWGALACAAGVLATSAASLVWVRSSPR
jgi:hypothetical protein